MDLSRDKYQIGFCRDRREAVFFCVPDVRYWHLADMRFVPAHVCF